MSAMDQDGSINFKALRARFQEEAEARAAQAKHDSRPTIAEKPRHLPPAPRVIFRSDLRSSGGKRPVSFPPQTSPLTGRAKDGDCNAAAVHQPRPASSAKEPKPKQPTDTLPPTTKAKKKGLLLPFRTSKSSKATAAGGEESAYAAHMSIGRPASAPPGELPSSRGQDEACVSRGGGDGGPLSSPDLPPMTPPSGDTTTSGDSDSRLMSTLDRAKKKFSRKHMLMYGKSKSLPVSPEATTTRGKVASLPSKDVETSEANFPVPAPICLPHLACISARPFFKADGASRKTALDMMQLGWGRYGFAYGRPAQPTPPPIRSLPDLASLGPSPAKPPRPPCVHLDLSLPPVKDPSSDQSTAFITPVVDAPDFPDFDHSIGESPDDDQSIDIASLELEALEFSNFDLPPPANREASYYEAPDPAGFDLQDPDSREEPAGLPEPPDLSCLSEPVAPESWCGQDLEDIAEPPPVPEHGSTAAGEDDPGASEAYSSTEETERAGHHVALANGTEAQPSSNQQGDYYNACDNVYEDVENINRYLSSHNSRKPKEHKGGPKNPYADTHQAKEEVRLNIWPRNPWSSISGEHGYSTHPHFHRDRQSPDHAEHKDQKKRERQRLEKEKKEQKEKEKRENEMKKKFKVTGVEEPLYHAKVMVASKVRKKNDLPVTSGDTVSIIRTTNCPRGRWLARDANHKYGYISVMNVELNIKEMLELGKKAQAAGRGGDADTISIESRSSNYPALTSSFTDDSEEWACEDETLSPSADSFHQRAVSMPEMTCSHASAQHTLSDANLEDLHTQTHEALQKLAIFFQHNKEDCEDGVTPTNVAPPSFLCAVGEPAYLEQEVDFIHLELLPPPPLYADTF